VSEQTGSGARRRVVITGLGAVSPFGEGVGVLWDGLCAGRSGIRTITQFDTAGYENHCREVPGSTRALP
jgi:3-oxoacyl-[acyl-carrier-protein] synthase II